MRTVSDADWNANHLHCEKFIVAMVPQRQMFMSQIRCFTDHIIFYQYGGNLEIHNFPSANIEAFF